MVGAKEMAGRGKSSCLISLLARRFVLLDFWSLRCKLNASPLLDPSGCILVSCGRLDLQAVSSWAVLWSLQHVSKLFQTVSIFLVIWSAFVAPFLTISISCDISIVPREPRNGSGCRHAALQRQLFDFRLLLVKSQLILYIHVITEAMHLNSSSPAWLV